MEYGDIRHYLNVIHSELLKYKIAITKYQKQKDTWKNPNTCKKYLENMEKSAELINASIIILKNNRVPIDERLIAKYNLCQRIHANLIA